MDDKAKELIAIGCLIAADCHPSFTHHVNKARTLGSDVQAIN